MSGVLSNTLFAVMALVAVAVSSGAIADRPLFLAAVRTNSMAPLLREGDIILAWPYRPGAPLSAGDVVVFRSAAGTWAVHRIVGGDPLEGYLTRGDANPANDQDRVLPRDVAGVVPLWSGRALRIPRLGRLSTPGVLPRPAVTLTLVTAAAVLMVRALRQGERRRTRYPLLEAYGILVAGAFLAGFMPAYALSQREPVQYEVLPVANPTGLAPGQVVAGEVRRQTVPVRNPLPLPVLVLVRSSDPGFRASPPYALLPPAGVGNLNYELSASAAGRHQGVVDRIVTLPVLPPAILTAALRLGAWAPAALTALVPALLVLGLSLGDRRLRFEWRRWRGRGPGGNWGEVW